MRSLFRTVATALVLAVLAPVVGAGAVLADDLRDMLADSTGLADDPSTPGPDLFAPVVWGTDIPDMPSLVVLDAPTPSQVLVNGPLVAERVPDSRRAAVARAATREIPNRGPPVS